MNCLKQRSFHYGNKHLYEACFHIGLCTSVVVVEFFKVAMLYDKKKKLGKCFVVFHDSALGL